MGERHLFLRLYGNLLKFSHCTNTFYTVFIKNDVPHNKNYELKCSYNYNHLKCQNYFSE